MTETNIWLALIIVYTGFILYHIIREILIYNFEAFSWFQVIGGLSLAIIWVVGVYIVSI